MDRASADAWAWAILDRVITPDKTGFTEQHTVAVARTRDPQPSEFVHQPEVAFPLPGGGGVDFLQPLDTWGWSAVGGFTRVDTRVRQPTQTRTRFGAIEPYRAAARVRRGRARPTGTAVPYGGELAGVCSSEHHPVFLGGDSEHPLLGSVSVALRILAAAADTGVRHCEVLAPASVGAQGGRDCVHMDRARDVVAVFHDWFPDMVRTHGWPVAGVDSHQVCRIAAVQAGAHPDEGFRTECHARVQALAAAGGIDPEHLVLVGLGL